MRLVECVPNFSEGRNQVVIDAIAAAISGVEGAHLLDVDPGRNTNRTVFTFVAVCEAAVETAFRAVETAARLIDMSKHQGEHPRMGATDVCPFVPLGDVTMEECVALARELGKRVGDSLGIPVYLYENAAKNAERRNLANIRSGEYEGFAEKLKDPRWKPDFGPAKFNAKSGATAIGAREFLIAYNVNLNTTDRKLANDIALSIREAGRIKRDENGEIIRGSDGKAAYEPGTLKAVKAVGWYIEDYRRAQVSINLVNYKITPPAAAFDEVSRQARERGLRVTGSEIVGLIPLDAMLHAGRHYLTLQGKSTGVPEKHLIETAIQSLGLNDLSPFDPRERIIEYRVARTTPLIDGTVRDFVDITSTDTPVPGGGSVAALLGSLASALASMVANLTAGKKKYEAVDEEMKSLAARAQILKDAFLRDVEDDSRAFDEVMSAMRLPKKSEDEKRRRVETMERATKRAVEVPLSVLERCRETAQLIETVARKGNENSISDAGVAAKALEAAASGALLNVVINLPGISDERFKEDVIKRAETAHQDATSRCRAVFETVLEGLRASSVKPRR